MTGQWRHHQITRHETGRAHLYTPGSERAVCGHRCRGRCNPDLTELFDAAACSKCEQWQTQQEATR